MADSKDLIGNFDFLNLSDHDRYLVLDSLFCQLHNKGYELQGNTEQSDFEWFAHILAGKIRHDTANVFERLPAETQEHYREIAKAALETIPALMSRISARFILHSQALHELLRAEWVKELNEPLPVVDMGPDPSVCDDCGLSWAECICQDADQ